MKQISYKEILELVCRWYVFFFLTAYGLAKLIGGQFYSPDRFPEELINVTLLEASNFELAWVFMGRSFGYMLFIGLGEIIGALLLLFNRTKLIGALILTTIMVHVIVFDVFFLDEYGALASAIIYFLMLITILWINKESIIKTLYHLTQFKTLPNSSIKTKVLKYASILILIGVIFSFNQFIVSWLGYGKG